MERNRNGELRMLFLVGKKVELLNISNHEYWVAFFGAKTGGVLNEIVENTIINTLNTQK